MPWTTQVNEVLTFRLGEMTTKIGSDSPIPLHFPPVHLCTGKSLFLFLQSETDGIDNAAMIAWTAVLRIQADQTLLEGSGEGYDLPLRPKWSLEKLYDDLEE